MSIATSRLIFLTSGDIFIGKTVILELAWVLESVYELDRDAVHRALELTTRLTGAQVEDAATVRAALDACAEGTDFADTPPTGEAADDRISFAAMLHDALGRRYGIPVRTFRFEKCHGKLWRVQNRLLVMSAAGAAIGAAAHMSLDAHAEIVKELEAAGKRVFIAWNFSELLSHDPPTRKAYTQWLLARRNMVVRIMVYSKSALLRMGVNTVNMAFKNFGTIVSSDEQFLAKLDEWQAWLRQRDSGRPNL